MPNPFLNRPKIEEGGLTYIWDSNVGPNDYDVSDEDNSITMHARSTGLAFKYAHAVIGDLRADVCADPASARKEGYRGIYSLNGQRPLRIEVT